MKLFEQSYVLKHPDHYMHRGRAQGRGSRRDNAETTRPEKRCSPGR